MKSANKPQPTKPQKSFGQYIAYAAIGVVGLASAVAVVVGEPARAEIAVANAASIDLTQATSLLGLEN